MSISQFIFKHVLLSESEQQQKRNYCHHKIIYESYTWGECSILRVLFLRKLLDCKGIFSLCSKENKLFSSLSLWLFNIANIIF